MLEITGLSAGYDGLAVLHDISLTVGAHEFVAIVGPNGAGKTTLFKTISGIIAPMAGRIVFDGQELPNLPPDRRAHLGIAHVPEGRQVFPSLSVLENLEMGAFTKAGRAAWHETLEQVFTWFPVLKNRQKQPAGTLSGGEQQMLAVARGLAAKPRLLMLDEPSMGLSPVIAEEIFDRIVEIHRQSGVSILLVEQRVAEALSFANRGYVLEAGRFVLEGSQKDLQDDDRIRQAYLGM